MQLHILDLCVHFTSDVPIIGELVFIGNIFALSVSVITSRLIGQLGPDDIVFIK